MKIQSPFNTTIIQGNKSLKSEPISVQPPIEEKTSAQATYFQSNTLSDQTTKGLLDAQELASETGKPQTAREQFLEYMQMTPEERMFYAFLKNKEGLSKEEFEALSPEEQQRIKNEIQQEIKEKIETGQLKPEEMMFYT